MVSTIVTISIIAVAVFATIAALVSRYKRCPSDKVLVVYGKVGKNANGQSTAKCIHGGASFIWPVIQDFAFMDLKPMALDVNLQNALSKQNIRLNVPSTYTVAINTEASYVNNAAERLLGLDRTEIGQLAKDIILGQMRLVIATMGIEEINTDRDQFLSKIQECVEGELQKIGLKLINANIVDIQDESGYIEALGKEAAAKAINDAKVSVSEKNRDGAIGEANANQDKRTRVAELTTKAEIGEANAIQEKRIKLAENDAAALAGEAEANAKAYVAQAEANAKAEAAKAEANAKLEGAKALATANAEISKAEAESNSRQRKAELNATAIKGENSSQIQIAESAAERQVKEAEANRKAVTARKVKEAEALKESYKAQEEAEKARADKDKASQFADVIVKAEIEKNRIELSAEAEAEKERRIAKGKADAKFAEMEAEAKGNYERLAKQAEGIQKLVQAAGGDPDKAIQLMLADKIETLYSIQVDAIKNVKIDKITVWDQGSGNGAGTGSSTSDFLRSMLNIVPGFDEVYKMAGKELPSMLQGAGEKTKAAALGENEAKAEISDKKQK